MGRKLLLQPTQTHAKGAKPKRKQTEEGSEPLSLSRYRYPLSNRWNYIPSLSIPSAIGVPGEDATASNIDEGDSKGGGKVVLRQAMLRRGNSQQTKGSYGSRFTKPKIDFLKDPIDGMTYGRRIALYLMDKPWYNPQIKSLQREQQQESEGQSSIASSVHEPDDTFEPATESKASEGLEERECLLFCSDKSSMTSLKRRINSVSCSGSVIGNCDEAAAADDDDEMTNIDKALDEEGLQGAHIEKRPPLVSRKEHPSLARAWAFFEHVTLPRYMVDEDFMGTCNHTRKNYQVARADPGEDRDETQLYNPFNTHSSQLGDFGIGTGLYFSTVRAMAILLLVAAILNIPTMLYFSSDEYNANEHTDIPYPLRGSAICTDTTWVPCPTCNVLQFHKTRFANATVEINLKGYYSHTALPAEKLHFAKRNNCEPRKREGMIAFATLILILVGMTVLLLRQRHYEIMFDEDEQTAQDYSIQVTNPPRDALDPEEWRSFFFDKFGARARVVTVSVDNDLLLNALVQRREYIRRIELMVEPGTKLDSLSLALLAAQTEKKRSPMQRYIHRFINDIPELFSMLGALEAKIEGMAQLDYEVTNIFASFETESEQRRVLSLLNASPFEAHREESYNGVKFRDEHVLLVDEPHEPSTILWQNLNEDFPTLLKAVVSTTTISVGFIVLIAFGLKYVNLNYAHRTYGIVVSILNQAFPRFAEFLTNFEDHKTESHRQTSLYFKINLFRWLTTAVIITMITRFDKTLMSDGLIKTVYPILQAEVITSNLLHLTDAVGHVKRHIVAPRAKTQDSMNLNMKGAHFSLAERFTNMTKLLFVSLWFSPLYPSGLFIASFALFLTYFVDRINLMRTWGRAPLLGSTVARFSRHYFIPLAIVCNAIVGAYTWAGFPYDNLCETSTIVSTSFVGYWELLVQDNSTGMALVEQGDSTYEYCNQQVGWPLKARNFPPRPRLQASRIGNQKKGWMTPDQEFIVGFYGWASVAIVALVTCYMLFLLIKFVGKYFHNDYQPFGKDQGIPFSAVKSISGYIPQVPSNLYSYPLLGCNTDGMDPGVFDWMDPHRPYSYYDLTKDAIDLVGEDRVKTHHVFSKVSVVPLSAFGHADKLDSGVTESHEDREA